MAVLRKESGIQADYETKEREEEKIGFTEKLGYGLGDLASNLIFAAVSSFLVFYYTDIAGASAAAIGTIILLSRVLDGITDIGMGFIVDKTNSKHGKARPWLLWMAIPFTLSAILLFTVPDLGEVGTLIYIAITYNVVHIIYTAINIPYGVLNARMTQDSYQRATLNIFRMFSALIATVIIMFLTLPLVEVFGGGKTGWTITFTIFGIIAGLLFFTTFLTTKERITAVNENQEKLPMNKGVKALFKNKYWALMVLFSLVTYTANGLSSGLGVYYAQYILENPALVGPLGFAGLFPVMIGLLFIAPIIKKYGKRNSMLIGLIISLIGTAIIFVDPSSFSLVLIGSIVRGIGGVPMAASFFAMLADTIEYGEWKTGVRTEGLVYSAGSFGTKVGSGLGAALMGWLLALGGYVGGVAEQSESAISMIMFLFVWAPAIIAVLQMAILAFYKLDKIYPQILSDLQKRKTN